MIRGAFGTCEAVKVRGGRHWCPGYGATVCEAAFEAWKNGGQRELDLDAIKAHLGARTAAGAAPTRRQGRVRRERPPDVQLATAAGDLEASWKVWAPHERGPSGFHDVNQRSALAVARSVEDLWDVVAAGGVCPNLLMLGHNGTGKTLLARCLARSAWNYGLEARFVDFTTLLKRAKETHASGALLTEEEVLGPYMRADLLVLDDVRPVYDSQDDENIATALLAYRYGERGADGRVRPTIVTSQLKRSEVEKVIGSSAMRRLAVDGSAQVIVFDWPAYKRTAPSEDWWLGPFAVFDVETTGIDPAEDRFVQVAFGLVRPGGQLHAAYQTIVDPGVEISEEAVSIHGITNDEAKKGKQPTEVVPALVRRINRAAEIAMPIVIFNASFDWAMLHAEARRHDLEVSKDAMVLDPMLLDRHFDKYRKGKRKLADVCKHLGVQMGDPHEATADAVAAGRLMMRLADLHADIRYWSPRELQRKQAEWYDEWIGGLREYWTRKGDQEKIDSLDRSNNTNPWRLEVGI